MTEFPNSSSDCLVVGDFRILRELARGAHDVVYEARLPSLDSSVAIKVHRSDSNDLQAADGRSIARWTFRARSAMRLHHTHIVPIHGVGTADGLAYYVMPLISGRNLRALLNESQSSEAAEDRAEDRDDAWFGFARWALHAADALAYAHRTGIIHGRLTPSNIIIDDTGKLWISGFAGADTESLDGDAEDARRHEPNAAGDVYALGAIFHEMVNSAAVHARLGITSPTIPEDLDVIIRRALDDNPRQRYSAEALAADLQRFLNCEPLATGAETIAHSFSKWYRRNTVAARMVLTTMGLLLVALSIVTWRWNLAEQEKLTLLRSRNEAIALRESAMLAKEAKDEALQAALAQIALSTSDETLPTKQPITVQPTADQRTASRTPVGLANDSGGVSAQTGS